MDSGRNSIIGTATAVADHSEEDVYIKNEQTHGELGHRMAEDEAQAPTGPRKFQHACTYHRHHFEVFVPNLVFALF